MATTYTVQMFYIGNFADMDTDETDQNNENPNVVLGTYDKPPITEVNEVDANDDGAIYDDETPSGDYLTYDTGSGATTTDLDSSSLYNAEILLGDGSIMSVPVLVIQAANGDVFVSENPENPLDGLSIQSISLVSLNTSEATGINAGMSDVQNAKVVCYAAATLIDTPDGLRAVETLKPGDLISTCDHGPQPIRWVRTSVHPLTDARDDAAPVLIKAGALGRGRPTRDLVVSPQHRILVGDCGQLDALFSDEVFVPAKSLVGLPGIRQRRSRSRLIWVHFACARHEVVTANGCLSESLLLGPMVLRGMSDCARRTLKGVFGPVLIPNTALNGPPARVCLSVREVRRHIGDYLGKKGDGSARKILKRTRDLEMENCDNQRV